MNIEKIFSLSASKLKTALRNEMCKLGYAQKKLHNKKDFLYVEGDAPYMLVAHLDTVHENLPSIICYSKDGNYITSPQGIGGDDRCGVYIILALLERLPFKPYVLFTMGEEIGGIGAKAFTKYVTELNLKYIVEYDRKGDNDCVFYNCDNTDFVDFVEQFGFKEAYGTFSDISVVAPALKVAAVNISSGYYNPHTKTEYVSMFDMQNIIERSVEMLCTESEAFEYVERTVNISRYLDYYTSRDVVVSFVPECSLWVYDAIKDDYRPNEDKEVVVDALGTLYKWSAHFDDYSITHSTWPIEDDFVPEYDENNTTTIKVYGGVYF